MKSKLAGLVVMAFATSVGYGGDYGISGSTEEWEFRNRERDERAEREREIEEIRERQDAAEREARYEREARERERLRDQTERGW